MRLTDPRFKSAVGIGALRTVYPSPVKPSPVRRSPVREIRFFKRLPALEDSILPETSGYQGFDLSSRSYAGAFPSAKTSPMEKDSDHTERSEGGFKRRGDPEGREIQKDGKFRRAGNSEGGKIRMLFVAADALFSSSPLFFIMNDKETEMPPVPEKTMFLCTE